MTETDSFPVQEVRVLKSRCLQEWFPLEAQRGIGSMPVSQLPVVASKPWYSWLADASIFTSPSPLPVSLHPLLFL